MTNKVFVNNSIYAYVTGETDDKIILRTYALKGEFFINTVSLTKEEFKSKFREATVAESLVFCLNVNKQFKQCSAR